MNNSANYNIDEPEVGLVQILQIINRAKWKILFYTLVPTLLTFYLVSRSEPLYEANGSVLIEPKYDSLIAGIESAMAGVRGDDSAVRSQAELLRSRSVSEQVITRLNLENDQSFLSRFSSKIDKLKSYITGPIEPTEYTPEEIFQQFSSDLKVLTLEGTRVIEVKYRSATAEQAANVVNTLIDVYLGSQLDNKVENISSASDWLKERVDQLKSQVGEAEKKIEEFRAKHGLIETNGSTILNQEIASLNGQLITAKAATAEARARMQQARKLGSSGAESAGEVLSSQLIQTLRGQEAEIRRRLAELSTEFGPKHPKILSLEAEVKDIRREINNEVKKITRGIRNELEIAQAREASLKASLDQLTSQGATANLHKVQLDALEREANAGRTLLNDLLEQQKEISAQSNLKLPADAFVISKAGVPTEPAYPKVVQTTVLAFMGFLVLNLFFTMLREMMDKGFRSAEEIESAVGHEALGIIPRTRFGSKKTARNFISTKPRSAIAQSLRTLLWTLRRKNESTPDSKLAPVILVTSATPNEGKSTVSSGLASICATEGFRPLLIDTDVLQPKAHTLFDVPRIPGLTDILLHKARENTIRRFGDGVSLVTAGSPIEATSRQFASKSMAKIIASARQSYDMVIIDCSPILVSPDASLMSKFATSIVLACKWNQTSKRVLQHAIKTLGISETDYEKLGVLLTMVDTKQHAKYEYGDSAYHDAAAYYGQK